MNKVIVAIALLIGFMAGFKGGYAQNREKIAVIGIDVKGIGIDHDTFRNMVLLELEKANKYEVLDRYDVGVVLQKNDIDVKGCFGRTCQVEVGKMLNADKMLTGTVDKFGNRFIFIFRLIDVRAESVIMTDVMEFIDQPEYIATMLRMSINNMMGIPNDRHLVDLLVTFDQPVTSLSTTLNLDGPRVGVTYFWGSYADRMRAPSSEGGFDMYPASVMIGYQFEKRFLSAGDFQALFELVPSIIGMESGQIIPSLAGMVGFRFNNSGFEFGLGPVIRGTRVAEGYFDDEKRWHLLQGDQSPPPQFPVIKTLDNRGDFGVSYGMIFAIGKTFRSGYLNMPVNLYYSPRKEGSVMGLVMGFNVANRPRLTR